MPLLPAAIAIIFDSKRDHILLVKRKDVPVWVLPGGGVEANETAEEAVIREVQEETGALVTIERKCAEYTPRNQLGAFTTVFVCHIKKGKLLKTSEEAADIRFHSLHQLPSLFFPIHKNWLDDALQHSTLVQKPLRGVNYRELIKYFFKHPWLMIRYFFTRLTTKP